ncbi:GNAT family N-acetyltransferase [Nakamurella deserti]|uniref:GNAT family N-acetyltransferase n=1 Tax=Nakamurella deserti TaxID=2164074 RepID=UPI0013003741|nr:GNAT family N-acetyltransferase [Nakamurella deserti]
MLRPFTAADAGLLAGMASDPRITRFVGDGLPWDRDRIEQRVTEAVTGAALEVVGGVRWSVAEENGRPCALGVVSHRESGLEIGYWVAVTHWGRGIGRATARLLIAGLAGATATVFARVHPDNAASIAVLTGLGMRRTGTADGVDRYELPGFQRHGNSPVPSP